MQVKHYNGTVWLDDVECVIPKGDGESGRVGKGRAILTEQEARQLVDPKTEILKLSIRNAAAYNMKNKHARIEALEAELKQLKETL